MSDLATRVTEYCAHSYQTWSRQKGWKALFIKDAEGVYFYDDKGKRYIDFASQLMCSNLGHKNKAVIEAIVKQAEKLPYMAPGFATDESMDRLGTTLSLPPFLEPRRAQIEAGLKPL